MGNSHICAFHPSFYNRIESHRMGNRPHISDTTTRQAIFMQPSHVTVGEPSALLHIFKALYHPIYSYKTAPLSTVPEQDARKWIRKKESFLAGQAATSLWHLPEAPQCLHTSNPYHNTSTFRKRAS